MRKKVGNTYVAVVQIVNMRVNPTFKYGPEGCGLGRPSADCFAERDIEEAAKVKRWSHPLEQGQMLTLGCGQGKIDTCGASQWACGAASRMGASRA